MTTGAWRRPTFSPWEQPCTSLPQEPTFPQVSLVYSILCSKDCVVILQQFVRSISVVRFFALSEIPLLVQANP